jgi:hypothetical protein
MADETTFHDPVAGAFSLEFECSESWQEMPGSGARRHCGACNRNVHQLADYSSREVHDLLQGGACVRAEIEPDGQLVTLDSRPRRLGVAAAIAATLAVGGGCADTTAPPPGQEPEARVESFEEYRQRVQPEDAQKPMPEVLKLPRGVRAGTRVDGVRWGYEPARTRGEQGPQRPPLLTTRKKAHMRMGVFITSNKRSKRRR